MYQSPKSKKEGKKRCQLMTRMSQILAVYSTR